MDVPDPVPATSSVSADHPSSGNRTPRDSPVKKEKKPKLETKPVQVIKSELKQQKTSDLKAKKPSVPDASAACGAPQVEVKKQEKCAAKKEFPAKVKLETAKVKLERGLTTPTKQSPETPKATQRKEKRRFDKVDKVIATGTDLGQAQHAENVAKDGVYLDALDLSVIAQSFDEPFMVRDTHAKTLEIAAIADYVKELVPGSSLDLKTSSGKQWTFILCNANYDSCEELNHWVPAISSANVGEEYLRSLMGLENCQVDLKIAETQHRYIELLGKHGHDKASAEESSLLDRAEQEMFRAQNWQKFRTRCATVGLHPMEVPCDGNCLVWSALVLISGEYDQPPESHSEMMNIRKKLSQDWMLLQEWDVWRSLFHTMHSDFGADTPKKVKPNASAELTSTPFHDKKFQKKEKPKMVDQCARAPNFQRARPNLSLTSKSASKRTQQDDQAKVKSEEAEIFVPECEATGNEPQPVQKRRRCGKKKNKTIEERKLIRLRKFLAKSGAQYARWQSLHWQAAGSKKCGTCPDGKYTDFQKSLAFKSPEDRNTTCPACKSFLELINFDDVACKQYMDSRLSDDDGSDQEADASATTAIVLANVPYEKNSDHPDHGGPAPLAADAEEVDLSLDALCRSVDPYYQARSLF
ncbi:unnamed protein product [Durusdinium trenchii]|uniref:Uncharacterized protein n=2 Tax=Durusdinium trenchii TaxID=1381693 RepID=A0ABP0KYS2_9DINO